MICVKFTAFCDLRADLRIRLATLCKSVRKFWFCKLASTCESVWPGFKTLVVLNQCVSARDSNAGSKLHARPSHISGNESNTDRDH